jgi:hypothetical protein
MIPYLDAAKAFTQWGRYDRAYLATRNAEIIAADEIAQRPTVPRMADVAARGPADHRTPDPRPHHPCEG